MTGTIDPKQLEEAKRLKAEREEKARRMHREVTLLFERDPIGRLIAAWLRDGEVLPARDVDGAP